MKESLKSKKVKNLIATLVEILIVAGLIFGILMYVQNKLDSGGETASHGVANSTNESQNENEKREGNGNYQIEVNIKKSAVIVYEYDKEGKNKEAVKVFKCSIGSDVTKGKFTIKKNYTWLEKNGAWHKYNTQISTNGWIHSVNYDDKYDWTLDKKSYKALGSKQKSGECILLSTGDAEWIYKNCSVGTKVKIIKGSKKDTLPLEIAEMPSLYKKCGWDPTDGSENNPYNKKENNKIVVGADIVYVEKGTKAKYLNNLIALDSEGKNVIEKVKYKEFDTDTPGTHKVKFTYKDANGNKIKATVKFEVIDTTCPVVTMSKTKFTYTVESASPISYQTKAIKEAIEKMVKACATANESGVTIKAYAWPEEQLVIGENPVRVAAVDAAGNIGSTEVSVEIVVKEKKLNKKYKAKKKKKEEETTKKKSSKKKDETTSAEENNTTEVESTTVAETQTETTVAEETVTK